MSKFHEHYSELLKKLLPSIKKNLWNHLITRLHNPLTEEQASSIHPDIEILLTSEIDKYEKKKNRQRYRVRHEVSCSAEDLLESKSFMGDSLSHKKQNQLQINTSSITEVELEPHLTTCTAIPFQSDIQVIKSQREIEEEINTRVKEATNALRQEFIKSTKETLKTIKQQKDIDSIKIKTDMGNWSTKLFESTLKKYIRDGSIYYLIHQLEEKDGKLYPDISK